VGLGISLGVGAEPLPSWVVAWVLLQVASVSLLWSKC
jgi:hypothetical protein